MARLLRSGLMNLWGSLFDWSFASFVTPKLAQLAFGFVVVVGAVGTIAFDVGTLVSLYNQRLLPGMTSRDMPPEFWAVVVSPLAYIAQVIVARVWLEFLVVVFRIAERLTPPGQPPFGHR